MTVAPILTVSDLSAGYGDICVLHDISFTVQPGAVVALVGANGVGKTTLLSAIAGLIPRRSCSSSLIDCRETPIASAKPDVVRP